MAREVTYENTCKKLKGHHLNFENNNKKKLKIMEGGAKEWMDMVPFENPYWEL